MKKIKRFMILLIIIISCYIVYNIFLNKIVLYNINEYFIITDYNIFGNHFNIEGCIAKKLDNPKLILRSFNKEILIDSNMYEEDNNTCFYISKLNNKGIALDDLNTGNYLLLVKDNDKYYSMKNNTDYSNLEYYTMTKNDINNKINIDYSSILNKSYIEFRIKRTKLPKDVYDITIDPGHGGVDSGALGSINNKQYKESDFTLKVSLKLKEELENVGYKVKITRDSDDNVKPYGKNGRAVIPNEVKSKLSISIHINSSESIQNFGGVEVYTPNDIDYTLSRLMADNLSDIVGYSKKQSFKIYDGVYFNNFTKEDIEEYKTEMSEKNIEMYNVTTNTPYMFMIREVGGKVTNAYIDGRDDSIDKNLYYNSNQVAEPYLIELGYINYKNDLIKLIDDTDLYAVNISKSIKQYYK